MQRTDVQLRRKTIALADGTMQTSLNGYVNGTRAYVPNVLLKKTDESEEETIKNFIADVNAGERNITGISEPREIAATETREAFTTVGSTVWGVSVRVATAQQKLDTQARIDALLARKAGRPEGVAAPDAVTELVRERTNVFTAMRERLAAEALAAQATTHEPVVN